MRKLFAKSWQHLRVLAGLLVFVHVFDLSGVNGGA